MFKYYEVGKLVKKYPDMDYYIIFGMRSNGKTYSSLTYALERYAKYGEQFVYLRRYEEDIRRKYMMDLFAGHIANGAFDKIFNNNEICWNSITAQGGRLYLTRTDFIDGKRKIIKDEKPVCYLFALNTWEHSKGVSFPGVNTVVFDEFLTRSTYLYDEVTAFSNFVSTIVRQRDNVKFLMLGNTVSPFSPYFQEIGLTHVADMKPGTTQVYRSGDGKSNYVIDYCESGNIGKPSDKYFSLFDNSKTRMITKGTWEMADYPPFPVPYDEAKVVRKFYIVFNGEMAQGAIVKLAGGHAVYWTPSTRKLFDERGFIRKQFENAIVYTDIPMYGKYVWFAMTKHRDRFTATLLRLLRENRSYFATNRCGELVRSYLRWSDSYSPKL